METFHFKPEKFQFGYTVTVADWGVVGLMSSLPMKKWTSFPSWSVAKGSHDATSCPFQQGNLVYRGEWDYETPELQLLWSRGAEFWITKFYGIDKIRWN